MLKAMIFDLDGTLGDTLPICVEGFKLALEPLMGRELANEEIYSYFGASDEGVVRGLVPDRFDEGIAAYLKNYSELHDRKCPRPFEGVREILEYLRDQGIFLAMVTGKGINSARISLDKFGLAEFFPDIAAGSPGGPRKGPCITAIRERHGFGPDEVVYVGDVPSDIKAAREAGVGIYSVAWAGTAEPDKLRELNPDRLFFAVEEFSAYLRELLENEGRV